MKGAIRMQRFLRAVAVLTAALLLVLCLPSCQDKTLAGRSFYFPLDAEPRQLDPQVSTDRSSMTVAAALFATVLLAKTVGGVLPMAAKFFKADPAIMAAPLITTIVDALSLVLYFTIASRLLHL